jgi:hypothetical protein
MAIAFDQQDYHPSPPKTNGLSKYKGECTNLMRMDRSKDLNSAVISDFTVFYQLLDARIPLNDMVITKRVEILWKTAYDLTRPSLNSNLCMLSLAELIRAMELSKDLVDKGNDQYNTHI